MVNGGADVDEIVRQIIDNSHKEWLNVPPGVTETRGYAENHTSFLKGALNPHLFCQLMRIEKS